MEERKQPDNRIAWIDNCKGLAIIMIVYAHCLTEHYAEQLFHSTISTWFSYFHVSIFFVIAGYLFAMKPTTDSFGRFLIKKVKRLLVPFWVFSIVYIVEIALFKIISGKDWASYTQSELINTVNGKGSGVLWFLSCLFIAEVILFFVSKIRNKIIIVGLATAITAIGLFCPFFFVVLRRSFIAVGFVVAGFFCYYLKTETKIKSIAIITSCCLLHIVGGVFCNGQVGLAGLVWGKSPIIYFILSITTCIGIMVLFQQIKRPIPILSYFGKESMIVLCTHMNIIEFLWVINGHFLHFEWFEGAVMSLATMLIEAPVIYVMKRWFPKTVGIWKKGSEKT